MTDLYPEVASVKLSKLHVFYLPEVVLTLLKN